MNDGSWAHWLLITINHTLLFKPLILPIGAMWLGEKNIKMEKRKPIELSSLSLEKGWSPLQRN